MLNFHSHLISMFYIYVPSRVKQQLWFSQGCRQFAILTNQHHDLRILIVSKDLITISYEPRLHYFSSHRFG
jgi:hypothetical protein